MTRSSALSRAAVAALACLAAGAAAADDRYFLAGGEAAPDAYYSYAGVVLPGPMREAGRGLVQRYWLDRFGYEYDGGPGRVKASAHGAEAALGYSAPTSAGWWGAYIGLRYTDTRLSPDDTGAKARGSQTGVKFQLEGEHEFMPAWRANAIASYTSTQDAHWSRLRLMHRTQPTLSLGVEAVAAGNRESSFRSAGVVLVAHPAGAGWSIGLKSGYRRQSGDSGAYGGVEFGVAF
jgi:hypothetical protein